MVLFTHTPGAAMVWAWDAVSLGMAKLLKLAKRSSTSLELHGKEPPLAPAQCRKK
jgi:hypothetical protein